MKVKIENISFKSEANKTIFFTELNKKLENIWKYKETVKKHIHVPLSYGIDKKYLNNMRSTKYDYKKNIKSKYHEYLLETINEIHSLLKEYDIGFKVYKPYFKNKQLRLKLIKYKNNHKRDYVNVRYKDIHNNEKKVKIMTTEKIKKREIKHNSKCRQIISDKVSVKLLLTNIHKCATDFMFVESCKDKKLYFKMSYELNKKEAEYMKSKYAKKCIRKLMKDKAENINYYDIKVKRYDIAPINCFDDLTHEYKRNVFLITKYFVMIKINLNKFINNSKYINISVYSDNSLNSDNSDTSISSASSNDSDSSYIESFSSSY